MPRRREVPKRKIRPDAVYDSELASRFINKMMKRGEKSVSERIFYQAMGMIEEKTGEDSMKILKKALDNVKPMLETKSRRVGGSTYQVPIEVSTRRRVSLGIRWIVNYARERGEKVMAERLANEVMEAAANRGSAVNKREDVRRMADANKAFAHYRW
ncbi:MAG: 30S ribosomal protein S7 [Acidobacteriota bacterium]|nr:30S ribosomal protein S7 [Acidobacteriota bacterium]